MSDFFAFPTMNSWMEEVFQLTTTGIIAIILFIVALIALALFLQPKSVRSKAFTTKQLIFSSAAMALATVTSMIKPLQMPMGGSVTLFSMLFITLIGYWYGAKAGILTGLAYGLLQFVLDPIFYTLPQMIVDYPLAFAALGLSGFFSGKKYGLQIGYFVGIFGRFVFAWLSGLLFFATYAEGTGMSAPVYSFCYNAAYIFTEAVITFVLLCIPPVYSGLKHVRKMALSQH